MLADPNVARIVTSYSGTVRLVRSRVLAFIQHTWTGLPSLHTADVDQFVARVVPVVAGGQRQIANLTDAYLSHVEQAALGIRARPTGIPLSVITPEAMRGVEAPIVYRRPAVTTWMALSNGTPFDAALGLGLTRALSIAATDLQLARTHAARYAFSQNDRVVGFRRVPGSGEPCDLCTSAAADQYRVEDLMPIHDRCSCGVEPIYGSEDPGQVIDPTSFEDSSADVAVEEHGELGPVLVSAGQHFKGPDDF